MKKTCKLKMYEQDIFLIMTGLSGQRWREGAAVATVAAEPDRRRQDPDGRGGCPAGGECTPQATAEREGR